jgi:hypothetical protein
MAIEAVKPPGTWSRRVLVAATVTMLILAFAPLGESVTCYESSDGGSGCTSSRNNLFTTEGAWILVIGLVPVLIALAPALHPARWLVTTTAVVLTLLLLVGAASIGLLFIPTVVLAWIAVVASSSGRN